MFNLGYRQVVLNNLVDVEQLTVAGVPVAGIPVVANHVNIPGYGKFVIRAATPDTANNWVAAPQAAARAKVLVTGPVATLANNAYNIRIFFTATERPLAEIFPERGTGGLMYQSALLAADDKLGDALVAGAVVDGFNDIIGTFTNSGIANDFFFELNAGYEGINIESVELTNSEDADARPQRLTFLADGTAGTVVGTVGVGLGKQIEAEVRNATFDNIDPYGINFGGNQAPDVRGQYVTIKFAMDAQDDGPGWEPHAPLGRDDANQATSYVAREYIIYAHRDLFHPTDAVDLITNQSDAVNLLLSLVSGI